MTLAAYRKALMMVGFTIVGTVLAKVTDGTITLNEWVTIAIAGVTSANVFAGPNVPGAAFTKAVLAGLGTVLAFIYTALDGGISPQEWTQVISIAAGAVFVYLVPNEPLPGGLTPSHTVEVHQVPPHPPV